MDDDDSWWRDAQPVAELIRIDLSSIDDDDEFPRLTKDEWEMLKAAVPPAWVRALRERLETEK